MGRVRVKAWEGKVETPFYLALHMVDKLFKGSHPTSASRVLDPGCGRGIFIHAIISWCRNHGYDLPEVVGVELDPLLAQEAQKAFWGMDRVKIIQGDFLTMSAEVLGTFDYIVGNPPYISYEKIDAKLRGTYKRLFSVAVGRFDTYMLFFEKALSLLRSRGRLVFVTPEKYLYVLSAHNLRRLLAKYTVEEIELVSEDVFGDVLAYPAVTVIRKVAPSSGSRTLVKLRSGQTVYVELPRDGSPWLGKVLGASLAESPSHLKLGDVVLRLSPGVATGRDDVFVVPKSLLPDELKPFAYYTISGRELLALRPGESIDYSKLRYVMLVPYDRSGRLLSEEEAKPLIEFLSKHRALLESRFIVKTGRKKWYAFHEDSPLEDILRPKVLFPDVAREPRFYIDEKGLIVPRHSVYYMVPKDPNCLRELVEYLNSYIAREWLKAYCQKAANGYLRLQTHVLRNLPLPENMSCGKEFRVEK